METFLEGYIRNCQQCPSGEGLGWVARRVAGQEGDICIL